ncbi:MAG: flagellar filament capping protein FliD, partial [Gammaproteobacteria bacterium]|nr:flagellar filament capping protein FliD [Gammaproteobacteria bacterium]
KETLVLTAENSGFDDRVQQSFGGTINSSTFGFDTINTDSSGITLSSDAELDASLIVDGVTLTRSDNSISDVVTGVTFNLVAEGDTEVSVQRSDSPITSAVQGIVDGFNVVVNTVNAQSASGSNSSLLRSVETQLRNAINDRISGLGTFSSLTELGITTTETGTLQLDKTVLSDALSTDRTGVETLFADDDGGFAVKLDNILTGLVQANGVLDSMVDGLNSQISGLQTHRENLELRLDSTEKRLRSQFTALDGLVARLNTTSNFLSTQLSNLSSILTKNS